MVISVRYRTTYDVYKANFIHETPVLPRRGDYMYIKDEMYRVEAITHFPILEDGEIHHVNIDLEWLDKGQRT